MLCVPGSECGTVSVSDVLVHQLDVRVETWCHQIASCHQDEDLSTYIEGWKVSCVAIPCAIGTFLQAVMWGEQPV